MTDCVIIFIMEKNTVKKQTANKKTSNQLASNDTTAIDTVKDVDGELEILDAAEAEKKQLEEASKVDVVVEINEEEVKPVCNRKSEKKESADKIDLDIDHSIFEDAENEEPDKFAITTTTGRSVTIDGMMLSREHMIKHKKRKKRQIVNSDFSNAKRIEAQFDEGLSTAEVEQRQRDGYVNVTTQKGGKTYGRIFFNNICTFFNLLIFVIAAALIVVGAGINQMLFLAITILNIVVGIVQEIRSKHTVDKLNLMTSPNALVIRDGDKRAVPITDVVLDDVIYLEAGKQICADCEVIKGEIEVNESLLTGESVPMRKVKGSELFSGSFVTSGSCYARAVKVGAANYVETLTSHAKKYRKPKSEINRSVRLIIRGVSIVLIPLAIIMLVINYRNYAGDWNKIISQVSGAVIGMIPAGMFLLTSVALAVSVIRLAKKKTLVQDLYCIEMLARVDVLCLDKTGTITDGTMQVHNIIEIKGGNTSDIMLNDIIGSILTATHDNNQTAQALANRFGYSNLLKPNYVMPFSSQRKFSAVSFEGQGTYMLGAPEFVLKEMGVRIEKIVNENAANGYRVMVLAHSPAEIKDGKLPAIRRPLCLIVIEDHIREDAIETIKWFKDNGVAIKVISGDNPVTVSEVARRVGVENAEKYISLEGLSNQEVIESANKYTVFGRVTPEQKSLLVKSIKAKGHTVAMTGDGVNDILAMREADCSVAIASGSEAARNVSHLVLLDSNFTSMPDVVREGRRVVNNIQQSSSLFLMKTFMSMALSVIFTLILRKPYPFDTSNLLLLELLVIGIPSFALALQPNHDMIKGNFLSNVIGRCVPGGITLTIATLAIYIYSLGLFVPTISGEVYTSMLVLTLTFSGMIILFKNCEPFDAYRTVLCVALAAAAIIACVFMPEFFGIYGINFLDALYLICVVLLSYFIVSILIKIARAARVLK